jgi:hypothetical protein
LLALLLLSQFSIQKSWNKGFDWREGEDGEAGGGGETGEGVEEGTDVMAPSLAYTHPGILLTLPSLSLSVLAFGSESIFILFCNCVGGCVGCSILLMLCCAVLCYAVHLVACSALAFTILHSKSWNKGFDWRKGEHGEDGGGGETGEGEEEGTDVKVR